jgi:PAS domain S-box-containing protein
MGSSEDTALIATICDALPVGAWVARVPDGAFVYANRAFQEIMGMGARQGVESEGFARPYGIYTRDGELYPERLLPFARALHANAAVVVDDIVIHRTDGRHVFIRAFAQPMRDAAGQMTNIIIAFTDMSDEVEADRKRVVAERERAVMLEREIAARARATAAEERLRGVVAHVPMILFAFDRDGVVTVSEGRGLEKLGWRAEDFIGRSVFDLYPDQPRISENCRRALAGEAFTNTTPLGAIYLETSMNPVRDARGEVVGVTGISTDVTERQAMNARLLQSERLASMGALAASVAHEINNPLTYVIGSLDLLTRQVTALEASLPSAFVAASHQRLAQAQEGADRVRRIVRGLKAFSRHGDDPIAHTDVLAVLEQSLAIADNEIRHRARLVREYAPLPPVLANDGRLAQVFVNLLVNAAQAIPEGQASAHEIRVSTTSDPGRGTVTVTVGDSGGGIAEEIRSRIFEPFFTTKTSGVGTGLGLSICYGIVKSMGGTIDVVSKLGGGSVFSVTLPAARAPAATPVQPMVRPVTPGSGARSILVVDDDYNVAHTLGLLLEDRHPVQVETSPLRALELITGGKRFDIIFCDLMMPEMTGMDLFRAIERVLPEQAARVVFMTGGAFTAGARDFLDAVPNARLEKPFKQDQLDAITRATSPWGDPPK